MQAKYEQIYHDIERTDWWYVARRDFVYRYLAKYNIPRDATILDIGCSIGELMNGLTERRYTNVTGIDISEKAIQTCHTRGFSNAFIQDAKNLKRFRDESFDLIIASDVLEHIDNDDSALQEWKRVLKPKGQIVIFVPAFPSLWSKHDELNQHKRRYTKKLLAERIKNSGITIRKISFWNSLLFIPYFLVMKISKPNRNKEVTIKRTKPFKNKILLRLIKLENTLILSGVSFPFGVSLLIIGINND